MSDFLERYRKQLLKIGLVFLIGYSFVNAVQMARQLLDDDDDDGHDHPKEIPEPPPDDGKKVTIEYQQTWPATDADVEAIADRSTESTRRTMPR